MDIADLLLYLRKDALNMRPARNKERVEELLLEGRELTTADFFAVCEGMPAPTVYARIRALQKSGRLSKIGRGKFIPVHKPKYMPEVTPWMLEVSHLLVDGCEGVNCCIIQKGPNLYVEAARTDLTVLEQCLREKYQKVIRKQDADRFPAALEGYIVISHLVSDAPVLNVSEEMTVPSIEKDLVDKLLQEKGRPIERLSDFQKQMEVYPVNINRLKRYAARRGLSEELSTQLSSLDVSRMEMFSQVQNYLAGKPISKAWVFGSFARGEETPESDLDLLVDYLPDAKVSLFDIVRYKLDMESLIHRQVDLVTNGTLRPFALPSAERDKYLIYER